MKIIGLSAGEAPVRYFGLSLFDEPPVSGMSKEGGSKQLVENSPGKYGDLAECTNCCSLVPFFYSF